MRRSQKRSEDDCGTSITSDSHATVAVGVFGLLAIFAQQQAGETSHDSAIVTGTAEWTWTHEPDAARPSPKSRFTSQTGQGSTNRGSQTKGDHGIIDLCDTDSDAADPNRDAGPSRDANSERHADFVAHVQDQDALAAVKPWRNLDKLDSHGRKVCRAGARARAVLGDVVCANIFSMRLDYSARDIGRGLKLPYWCDVAAHVGAIEAQAEAVKAYDTYVRWRLWEIAKKEPRF
ncbi:hypothetical protein Q5752_005792 [Cryptotrichosporon argae]